MKTYVFEITICEGEDEFWEEISKSKNSGCDILKEVITDAMASVGFSHGDVIDIKLKSYEDK